MLTKVRREEDSYLQNIPEFAVIISFHWIIIHYLIIFIICTAPFWFHSTFGREYEKQKTKKENETAAKEDSLSDIIKYLKWKTMIDRNAVVKLNNNFSVFLWI